MTKEIEEQNEEKLFRLRLLSKRLDEIITIPGTKYKIGSDPIIGFIPVIGDFIGCVLSAYIVYSGSKMGLPSKVIAKMGLNVILDFAIGSIPIIGDLFDIGWKANKKNIELIEININKSNDYLFTNNLITATLIIVILAIFLTIIRYFI